MRKIGGVILAAGGSTRMGEPKQLLEVGSELLVHAAVRAALEGGCDPVCVVTGHARAEVEAAVCDLRPLLVHNEYWQRGMGSSIRLGVRAVQPVSAVVVLASDQPAVTGETIRALIECHAQVGQPIVASHYSDTLGIPALFGQSCFMELQSLPDERGAKAVIEALPTRVMPFHFPGGAFDLDTPEDLHAWRARPPTIRLRGRS